MSYLHQPVNPRHVQDRKMEQLQQTLASVENQMVEQAELRRKLEQLSELDKARTQQTLERANSRNKILQEEIERVYGSNNPSPSPQPNRLIEEIMSKRTKDFQRSQAAKAANIQYLAQERQRILDARSRLKERQAAFRSLPSPVGKASQRIWGHKYLIYQPLYFDDYTRTYSPTYQDGYFTLFPWERWRNRRADTYPGAAYRDYDYGYGFGALGRLAFDEYRLKSLYKPVHSTVKYYW